MQILSQNEVKSIGSQLYNEIQPNDTKKIRIKYVEKKNELNTRVVVRIFEPVKDEDSSSKSLAPI